MKVAKLVSVSLMTRVIVEEDATDEQIMEVAIPRLSNNLFNDGILDNVEDIKDDTECPFGAFDKDKE